MTGEKPSAETPTHIARRALLAQLDKTIEELGKRRRSDVAVHNIRKELKRARAALRMLRDCIGVVAYRRDNALIRDAAHPLTPIRDAKVLLQTLEQVGPKKGADGRGFYLRFRKLLEEQRRLARRQLRSADLAAAARMLRGIRRRAAALPESRLAAPHARGLEHAFKKARSAFAVAKGQGTDESLHEWRKQTKYFANQLEMLLHLRPKLFANSHRHATQLADCLGDDHDLAILTEQVFWHAVGGHTSASNTEARGGARAPGTDARQLIGTMRRRRKKLQRRAMRLGQRLYAGRAARYRP
jgi:CHAD domain-containing protein